MDADPLLAQLFTGRDRELMPHLSVDCTIFGFHEGQLKLLLLRWKHLSAWSLPGGFVRRDEPLDSAAARVLRERTGLDHVFLRQFHAFGGVDRGEAALIPAFEAMGVEPPKDHWIVSRIVSVAYLALVDVAKVELSPDAWSDECRWWDLNDRPTLLFDHDAITALALETLRAQLDYLPLAANLLPQKFTMPELQRLYETVLGTSLDRRNFQKRMLDQGFIARLEERKTGGAHRSPYLYRFTRSRGRSAPIRRN
ncbi:MAG TPA: NUDIX domain-containing protein [Gemmatimonadaceae bacterium]|jgi:ADP-ribose pyrophosphatase YjhB (NUDIX family)|nr:NUDIX domain-containing protein [Gemmatimonadaceae bacterium]